MKRALALLATTSLLGCGEVSHQISVTLTRASAPELDPYGADTGLSKVRIVVDGLEAAERSIVELGLDETEAVFSGYPTLESARVSAFGFDARGNVVAFARRDRLSIAEDTSVSMPLRRNLAYAIHRANPAQDRPEGVVYLIDLATRGLVSKIRLPGTNPTARSVTARGGASLLVTVEDGGQGSVLMLSADDNSTSSIPLPRTQELALGVEGSPNGVAVGGGIVTFLDLDAGSVVEQFRMPVGGRVLDAVITADGRKALVVIDVSPGLLLIDLEQRNVESANVLPEPGGVALGADGRVAYVTSRADKQIVAIDLENGRSQPYSGLVKSAAGPAAFADELEAVFAVDFASDNGFGRVLGFVVPPEQALGTDEAVSTLPFPTGIATDGPGRRAVVVAAGTSTETAGITVIEATAATVLGASALYPSDPEDRYADGPLEFGQRYQPSGVAVIYGR